MEREMRGCRLNQESFFRFPDLFHKRFSLVKSSGAWATSDLINAASRESAARKKDNLNFNPPRRYSIFGMRRRRGPRLKTRYHRAIGRPERSPNKAILFPKVLFIRIRLARRLKVGWSYRAQNVAATTSAAETVTSPVSTIPCSSAKDGLTDDELAHIKFVLARADRMDRQEQERVG